MKQDVFRAVLVVFFCITMNVLSADHSPETWSDEFHNLFSDSEYQSAPIEVWEIAGSNAVLDSVFSINVMAIPAYMTYTTSDSLVCHIPSAVPDDDEDDSFTFSELVLWMKDNIANQGIHAQIYIPPGVYNFNNQIVMRSNISLKGAGSDMTELRFLILSDSVMTKADCQKDAIQINGNIDAIINNVGIEDLKIVRIRQGLSAKKVKARVAIPYSLPKAS